MNTVDGYRFPNEDTYLSVEFLKEDLRQPFTEAFSLTSEASENMSFMDLYGYSDVIQSNIFEGLGPGYNYTQEQMNEINETVVVTLVLPLSEPVLPRNMFVSKLKSMLSCTTFSRRFSPT